MFVVENHERWAPRDIAEMLSCHASGFRRIYKPTERDAIVKRWETSFSATFDGPSLSRLFEAGRSDHIRVSGLEARAKMAQMRCNKIFCWAGQELSTATFDAHFESGVLGDFAAQVAGDCVIWDSEARWCYVTDPQHVCLAYR